MKAAIFGILLVAFASSAIAEERFAVNMTGIGQMDCNHWRSTANHRAEGVVWVYGFWTGLNYVAAASEQPQAMMEPSAITSKVLAACKKNPSQPLASAAWNAFVEAVAR